MSSKQVLNFILGKAQSKSEYTVRQSKQTIFEKIVPFDNKPYL